MFAKKQNIDIKKSIQKILDIKKDPFSRLKHLKQCIGMNFVFLNFLFLKFDLFNVIFIIKFIV